MAHGAFAINVFNLIFLWFSCLKKIKAYFFIYESHVYLLYPVKEALLTTIIKVGDMGGLKVNYVAILTKIKSSMTTSPKHLGMIDSHNP